MRNTFDYFDGDAYLTHHGIKGMKWGIRRYQNEDGSLTPEGIKRYGTSFEGNARRALSRVYDLNARTYDRLGNKTLASMNRAAKTQQLNKAEAADARKLQKKKDEIASMPKSRKESLEKQNYQKYSKDNLPVVSLGKHFVNNAKYWKTAMSEVMKSDHKAKAYINAYLDQPLHVSGITGTSDTTLRKRLKGQFNEWY